MRILSHPRIFLPARLVAFLVLLAALCGAPGTPRAEDIRVSIDEARLIRLDTPGAEVIVGNPSIADVSVQSGRMLVVTGKSFGTTNVIVLAADGREILNRTLRVDAERTRVVTLYRGAVRQSYICTPVCQSTLIPGDFADYFENVGKQVVNKFGIAAGAIEGSVPAAQ